MTSLASVGKLNDVLRLELLLPAPPPDEVRPLLENDVRLEGGPDSPSVAATLLVGENERDANIEPLRSNCGISGYDGERQ